MRPAPPSLMRGPWFGPRSVEVIGTSAATRAMLTHYGVELVEDKAAPIVTRPTERMDLEEECQP